MEAEWERTEAAILAMTGRAEILEGSPVLLRSIRLRNPYVDPLNDLQIRFAGPGGATMAPSRRPGKLRRLLALTVNGISFGMKSTG